MAYHRNLYAIEYIDNLYAIAYDARMEQVTRNTKQVGEALRRVRRKGKLSQRQLGEKVGVRQATISSIEGGEPGTQLRTLMDVLAALGLELVIRERGSGMTEDIEGMF